MNRESDHANFPFWKTLWGYFRPWRWQLALAISLNLIVGFAITIETAIPKYLTDSVLMGPQENPRKAWLAAVILLCYLGDVLVLRMGLYFVGTPLASIVNFLNFVTNTVPYSLFTRPPIACDCSHQITLVDEDDIWCSYKSSPMKNFFLCCAAALLAATVTGLSQAAPKEMQLFLLIGQSNMAGRGPVEPQDQVTHPRVFMLDQYYQWVPAKDPVHFDKPGMAGVGLCSEFARTLVKADPAITVGLIPCAMGGTSLGEWKPGGVLYNNAVVRAKEAMKNGKLAGILWHQGESDVMHGKVSDYGERFTAMIAQLRHDLGAENVPLVFGGLGLYLPQPQATELNGILAGLPKTVPLSAFVSSEGLTHKGDTLHFDSASLRTFGARYAAAYLELKAKAAKP